MGYCSFINIFILCLKQQSDFLFHQPFPHSTKRIYFLKTFVHIFSIFPSIRPLCSGKWHYTTCERQLSFHSRMPARQQSLLWGKCQSRGYFCNERDPIKIMPGLPFGLNPCFPISYHLSDHTINKVSFLNPKAGTATTFQRADLNLLQCLCTSPFLHHARLAVFSMLK